MVLPVAPVFDRVRLVPRPNDFLNRNVGASGEIFYEKETKTLRVYNGLSRGGFEIVSQDRLRVNAANAEVATVKYNVTVSSAGAGNKYIFNSDGILQPELQFVVGYTYLFDQSDQTNLYYPNPEGGAINQHPLNFSSDNLNGELGGGTSYLDGVVYLLEGLEVTQAKYWNTFSRSVKREVQITITSSTPTTLYYWCQKHLNMGSTIEVGPPGAGSGSLEVSDTAPTNPSGGNIWYNSASGYLYVYVEDTDSSQWVQPVAGNVFSGDYEDLSNKPTIFDGNYSSLVGAPSSITDLGISDGSATQVLTTDGAGNFTFEDAAGGSSYDQSLNTTDTVTFASISSPTFLNSGTGVTNLTSASTMTLTATDSIILNSYPAPFKMGVLDQSGLSWSGGGASSISDNGGGDNTITFTDALGTTVDDFQVLATVQDKTTGHMVTISKPSTSSIRVIVEDDQGGGVDSKVFIVIYKVT